MHFHAAMNNLWHTYTLTTLKIEEIFEKTFFDIMRSLAYLIACCQWTKSHFKTENIKRSRIILKWNGIKERSAT